MTTIVYDLVGNVVNLIDPVSNTTTFVFDAANRLTQETDPLGNNATYAYDLANRETSQTDRLGRRRDFTYDAINRKTGETWVNVGGGTANLLTYTFDNNDNLLTAADYNGAYTMTFDALNRATVTQEPFALTLTATYDAVGNRTKREDNFGGVMTSTYNAVNRLTKREFGGTSQTPLRVDLTFTSRDQIATITRYSDLAGSSKIGSSAYTDDNAGRLTNLQHKDGANANISNYTHTYDLASRVLTEKLNGGSTVTYTYDVTNQLTNDGTNAYTYDLNGNRTMAGYTTGTGHQLTNDGVWSYTYDAEGNLTKKSKGTKLETGKYTYDHRNQLLTAQDWTKDVSGTLTSAVTYAYDMLTNRMQRDAWSTGGGSAPTERYGYDGLDVWVDLNGSNQLTTRRLQLDGVDQLYARIDGGGMAAWYLPDRLGSVRGLVDPGGTAQDPIVYDGFGTVTTEANTTLGDRYKYTSREFDSTADLQYSRARSYSHTSGSWTSRDPIAFHAGDPNLYRYAGNAPILASDPMGLETQQGSPSQHNTPTSIQANQVTGGVIGHDKPAILFNYGKPDPVTPSILPSYSNNLSIGVYDPVTGWGGPGVNLYGITGGYSPSTPSERPIFQSGSPRQTPLLVEPWSPTITAGITPALNILTYYSAEA